MNDLGKNIKHNKGLLYWGLAVLLFILGYTFVILQDEQESLNQETKDNSELVDAITLKEFDKARENAPALREKRLSENDVIDDEEELEEVLKDSVVDKVEDDKLTKDEIVDLVASGSFGNTSERKKKVEELGFDYDEIQSEVNKGLESKKANEADNVDQSDKNKETNGSQSVSSNDNKTIAELAKEVHAGKWGSGSQRAKNLTNAGYDAKAVQAEVNKKSTTSGGVPSSNSSSSNSQQVKHKANRIYVGGTEMGMRTANHDSLQSVIDSTTYTWIGFESFNPHDNKGTYFAQHNHTGGGVVLNQKVGNNITVTDSNSTPHSYTITKVLYNQEVFTNEILGNLDKEYIILQTSELRIDGNRVGNRILIADKN